MKLLIIQLLIIVIIFGCKSHLEDNKKAINKKFEKSLFDTNLYIIDTLELEGWVFFYPDTDYYGSGIDLPCAIPLFLESSKMIDTVDYVNISMVDLLSFGPSFYLMPESFPELNNYDNEEGFDEEYKLYKACNDLQRVIFNPHLFYYSEYHYAKDAPVAIAKNIKATFLLYFVDYYLLAQSRTYLFHSGFPEGYVKCVTPICK